MDKKRLAAMAAVLEFIESEGAAAGLNDGAATGLVGWKMAGRFERLGIGVSEIPFKGRTRFEIRRQD